MGEPDPDTKIHNCRGNPVFRSIEDTSPSPFFVLVTAMRGRFQRNAWKLSQDFVIEALPCTKYCIAGRVVVEHLPGMWRVGGSNPGCIKKRTLKFEGFLAALLWVQNIKRDWLTSSESGKLLKLSGVGCRSKHVVWSWWCFCGLPLESWERLSSDQTSTRRVQLIHTHSYIQWSLDIKTTLGTNTMWSLYAGGLYTQVQ